jgi:hypothetical protein
LKKKSNIGIIYKILNVEFHWRCVMTNFNRREYQTVILGALLHDAGKEGSYAKENNF